MTEITGQTPTEGQTSTSTGADTSTGAGIDTGASAGPGIPGGAIASARESYAFACIRCGHGWEQTFDIRHYLDGSGTEFVMYFADGQRVPSPLTRPTCLNCGGHKVRIMQAGQVSSILDLLHGRTEPRRGAEATEARKATEATQERESPPSEPRERHHWHLSDLLHPFSHRKDAS
ncbi:hypothetical protein [Streptomyces sp. NPDC002851]